MSETDGGEHERGGIGRIIDRLAPVLAPITVVTALLTYVGWVYTTAYFGYFGISESVASLSLQSYLFNSAAVTFGVVTYVFAAAGALVVADRLLLMLVERWSGRRRGRHLQRGVRVFGGMFAALGGAIALGLLPVVPLVLGPILLGFGAVTVFRSTAYSQMPGGRSRRRLQVAAVAGILAFVLFWTATLYANDRGQRAANAVDLRQVPLPAVTVYSSTYIDMPGIDGVMVLPVSGPGGVAYRYTNVLLLAYTNGRWLLITGKQPCATLYTDTTPGSCYRSSIYILRDSDSIRVEVDARGRG